MKEGSLANANTQKAPGGTVQLQVSLRFREEDLGLEPVLTSKEKKLFQG